MYLSNDWDSLANGRDIQVSPLEQSITAKFVHFKDREKDSYGDYYQGDDSVHVVFEVNGRFWKKSGTKSSYGYGIEWGSSNPVEVFPQTKTITFFE